MAKKLTPTEKKRVELEAVLDKYFQKNVHGTYYIGEYKFDCRKNNLKVTKKIRYKDAYGSTNRDMTVVSTPVKSINTHNLECLLMVLKEFPDGRISFNDLQNSKDMKLKDNWREVMANAANKQ